MYIPTLKMIADEGYDLIMVTGFTFADALIEVAPLYPKQKFMIVDVSWVNQPNVVEYGSAFHSTFPIQQLMQKAPFGGNIELLP